MSKLAKHLIAASGNSTLVPDFLVTAGQGGIFTFDYSDPANIVLLDSITTSDYVTKVRNAIFDKNEMLLIVSCHDGNSTGFVKLVDLSDPSNISEIASVSSNTMYAQNGYDAGFDPQNKIVNFAGPYTSDFVSRTGYSSSAITINQKKTDTRIDDPRTIQYDSHNNKVWVHSDDDNVIWTFNPVTFAIDFNQYVSSNAGTIFRIDNVNNRIILNLGGFSGDNLKLYDLENPAGGVPNLLSSMQSSPREVGRYGIGIDTTNRNIFYRGNQSIFAISYSGDTLSQLDSITVSPTYVSESTVGIDTVNGIMATGGRDVSGASGANTALALYDISDPSNLSKIKIYSDDDAVMSGVRSVYFVDFFVNE